MSGQKSQSQARYCSMLKTNFRASLDHCSKYINCKQIPNFSNIFKSDIYRRLIQQQGDFFVEIIS